MERCRLTAADQRPGAYADIKDAREERHGDVGGIRSGGQHFHLHAETDNHDRHPQKMLSSIRCCGLCEAGSSSSRQASSRAIAAYQPRRVLVTELTEQNAADNTGPARISSSTVAKLPLRPATVWTKGSI